MSKKNTAPLKACVLNDQAEVTFAEGDGEKKGKFTIVGYSGGIINNHWLWGNLAIDLEGCKFYKKCVPVLEQHFTMSRIGFTTKQTIENNVTVEGEFLDNDNAQAMQADMKQGFPMEASLFCKPSIVEHVLEGATAKANGKVVKGPGTVFRESIIKEVSMCVFGADTKTKSSTFDEDEQVKFNLVKETNIMAENKIESLVVFAEQYPDLHSELLELGRTEGVAVGEKNERDFFDSLKAACGDDNELVVKCFTEKLSPEEAAKLCVEKLQKANTELTETVTELQQKRTVTPAVQEFTDQGHSTDTETETGNKDDDALKAEFKASKELQNEFGGDVKSYIAYTKANADGQVRTIKK